MAIFTMLIVPTHKHRMLCVHCSGPWLDLLPDIFFKAIVNVSVSMISFSICFWLVSRKPIDLFLAILINLFIFARFFLIDVLGSLDV